MKRLDTDKTEDYRTVMIYGRTGSGKTSLAATCEDPFVILSERQGFLHLREACKRLNKPVPPVLLVEELSELRAIMKGLRKGGPDLEIFDPKGDPIYQGTYPKTVVVDSLTAVGRLVETEVDRESPPKTSDKDGLPVRAMRAWGVISDRFTNMVLAFRDSPVDVLFLALAQDKAADERGPRELRPQLPMGKLGEFTASCCNAVGYAFRKEIRGEDQKVRIQHAVQFRGPEYMLAKSCGGLRSREPSDFGHWVKIISGNIQGLELPPEPEASEESLDSSTMTKKEDGEGK